MPPTLGVNPASHPASDPVCSSINGDGAEISSRVTVKIDRDEEDNLHRHSALPLAGEYFKISTEVLSVFFLFKILCLYLCPVAGLLTQAAARSCSIYCLGERMTQQNIDKEGAEFLAFEF